MALVSGQSAGLVPIAPPGLGTSSGSAAPRRHNPRLAESPIQALLGGDTVLCDLLHARKVHSIRDLLYLPAWELRDWLLVPEHEAAAVIARAWAVCAAPATTAWELATLQPPVRVPLPLESLGAAVGGGLSGTFMEVAGPAGVGKTQFCLHLAALAAAEGGEVFWLDTEGTFTAPRALEMLEAICSGTSRLGGTAGGFVFNADEVRNRALKALSRIRRHPCASLQELHNIVSELDVRARHGEVLPALIVVDSIAAVARNEGDTSESRRVQIPRRQAALNVLAGLFKALVAGRGEPQARSSRSPLCAPAPPGIIVTNQVAGDPSSGRSRVTLGHVWHHAVNWRLVLSHQSPAVAAGMGTKEQSLGGHRFLCVEKSPSSAPIVIEFGIGRDGLEEVAVSGQQHAPLVVCQGGA